MKRHHRVFIVVAFGLTSLAAIGGTTAAASPSLPASACTGGVIPAHEQVLEHAPNGVPDGLEDLYRSCVA
jgi:hypothetical protein